LDPENQPKWLIPKPIIAIDAPPANNKKKGERKKSGKE
jgi:hypothetical protein